MDSSKAYVLMAQSGGESWGPVAVFTDKEKAFRARDILNERMHGRSCDEGREDKYSPYTSIEYPVLVVENVKLNPEIQDTRGQAIETLTRYNGWQTLPEYVEWEDYYFDDPASVWSFANGVQESPDEFRIQPEEDKNG